MSDNILTLTPKETSMYFKLQEVLNNTLLRSEIAADIEVAELNGDEDTCGLE